MKAIEQMSADELRAYAASLQAQVDKGTKKFVSPRPRSIRRGGSAEPETSS